MNSPEDYRFYRFLKNAAEMYNPTAEILEEHNLTFDTALKNAEAYRKEVGALLSKYNIKSETPEAILIDISRALDLSHDNDMIRLCGMALIDDGILFRNITDEEELVLEWINANDKLDRFIEYLQKLPVYKERLETLVKSIKVDTTDSTNLEEQSALYTMSMEHDFIYKNGRNNTYLSNLGELIRLVNSNDMLKQVKPYVYSAVICQKHKMMLGRPDYTPNIKSVFKYSEYKIHSDNGKNFDTYQTYIELYEQLRRHYLDNEEVDIGFSDYCFSTLSNLCDWFYLNCEPDENVPRSFRSELASHFGRLDLLGNTIISDDYYLEDFIEENPVMEIAFENTLNSNFDILKDFVNARYNNENTEKIVKEFFKLSGVEKMNDNTENIIKYAEAFLLEEMEINIRNMILDSLEEIFSENS